MGTEVLHPQDILGERFRVSRSVFQRRKSSFVNGNGYGNVKGNNYGYRKQLNHRPDRLDTKRKPTAQQTADHQFLSAPRKTVDLENHQLNRSSNLQHRQLQNGLEMGRVTVLRRGQSLDSVETKSDSSGSNIKIKGGILTKNKFNMTGGYGDSLYAGSAFAVSPAPESLPLPSFFSNSNSNSNNNNNNNRSKKDEYDAFASRDLRRLLRLE